jgi:DNA replication protein DnaC
VAQRCATDNGDYLGYLLQFTELELLDRERRAAERWLKAVRLPTLKTLEHFDFAAQPSLNKILVAELMRCEFIDRRKAVILIGNPGTGKTYVATALAGEACRRGKRVRFWRVTELVTQLRRWRSRSAPMHTSYRRTTRSSPR